jgi:hypothetical protein
MTEIEKQLKVMTVEITVQKRARVKAEAVRGVTAKSMKTRKPEPGIQETHHRS